MIENSADHPQVAKTNRQCTYMIVLSQALALLWYYNSFWKGQIFPLQFSNDLISMQHLDTYRILFISASRALSAKLFRFGKGVASEPL